MSIRAPASTWSFRAGRSPSEASTAFARSCGPPPTAASGCCPRPIHAGTGSPRSITGETARASPWRHGSPAAIAWKWRPSSAGAPPREPPTASRNSWRRRRGFSGDAPRSVGRGGRERSRRRRRARLGSEFLVEDLGDEAVEGDGIEAHVGGEDDAGVDDLALGQLVQGALDLRLGVAVRAQDIEVFALEGDLMARGVHEGEDARHQRLVHHLVLLEELAVGLSGPPGGEDEARRDLDLAADLHGAMRLLFLRPHEDVGEHVIARDDAGDGLAQDLRLLEEVLEELGVVTLSEHDDPSTTETSMQS